MAKQYHIPAVTSDADLIQWIHSEAKKQNRAVSNFVITILLEKKNEKKV